MKTIKRVQTDNAERIKMLYPLISLSFTYENEAGETVSLLYPSEVTYGNYEILFHDGDEQQVERFETLRQAEVKIALILGGEIE